MRKIRRWLFALTVAAGILGCVSAMAASSGTCGTNVTWTLDDHGLLTISGTGKIDDYSQPWSISDVRKVVISDGVTRIGDQAFYQCANLTEASIPASVTQIGSFAFGDCESLTGIAIPNGVTGIGKYAFYGCSSLTDLTIPVSVTSIGESAFSACNGLTRVTIPGSVAQIQKNTFFGCSSLTDLTIREGVTGIGQYAFKNCGSLTDLTIPNGVTSLADYAFEGCASLTNVTVPESVTRIGTAFSGCSSLKSFVIPDGVTEIASHAFNDCSSLTGIVIPDSVTAIGKYAFFDCSSLTDLTVPDSVTSIGEYAFSGCSSLTEFTIPGSVAHILEYTFSRCSSLTDLTIREGVTGIARYAFKNCESLTGVVFPNSLTTIGTYAFEGCDSLGAVTIPDSWEGGFGTAFSGSGVTSITLPDTVTSIGSFAFSFCRKLTNIVIPDSVTRIYKYAFAECSSLAGVTIPEGVTEIEESAFSGCASLRNVRLPGSLTSIGISAFRNCSSLSYITIPAGVINIGKEAFYRTSGAALLSLCFLQEGNDGFVCQTSAFGNGTVVLYCHRDSSAGAWASIYFPENTVYLEDVADPNTIRTICLPADFRLAKGETRKLDAGVFPADHSPSLTWSSSKSSVATVRNGTVTAVSAGTAVITAREGSASASVTVQVYIPATGFELSETEVWLVTGDSLSLSVTAWQPKGAGADIGWSSSDTTLATVDETGTVAALSAGDVTIRAITERGVRRECLVHVCEPVTAVSLTSPVRKLLTGYEAQLTAAVTMGDQSCVNHLVTFTSSSNSVAAVDGKTGLVRGVGPGTVTITARSANGKKASVKLTVADISSLTTLRLPAGLKTIGREAFDSIAAEAVIIPDECTVIEPGAFANCGNLLYVLVPAGIAIPEDAFGENSGIVIERK